MNTSPLRPVGIVAVVGGFLLVLAGIVSGGPDLVGGVLCGGIGLIAGAVILTRPVQR